jgi:hypothetical protein
MHRTRSVADGRKWERCRAPALLRRYGRISGQKSIYRLYAIGEIITTTNRVQAKSAWRLRYLAPMNGSVLVRRDRCWCTLLFWGQKGALFHEP